MKRLKAIFRGEGGVVQGRQSKGISVGEARDLIDFLEQEVKEREGIIGLVRRGRSEEVIDHELLVDLKAWARLCEYDSLHAMLEERKTLPEYIENAKRLTKSKLTKLNVELELERKKDDPNEFTINDLLNDIDNNTDLLGRIGEYQVYLTHKVKETLKAKGGIE